MKNSRLVPRVVIGALLVAFGVPIVGSVVEELRIRSVADSFEPVTAKVTHSFMDRKRLPRRTVKRFPVIEFEYTVEGKVYTGSNHLERQDTNRFDIERLLAEYPEGSETTVYFDPQHPDLAVLHKDLPVFWPLVHAGAGVACALVGAGLVVDAIRERRARTA